jgi:hypothetical protein
MEMPDIQDNSKNKTIADIEILKICKQMIDLSSKIECSKCNSTLPTTSFYEHIN